VENIEFLNVTIVPGKAQDDRIWVHGVNTVLEKTLDDIIDKERFRSRRVLEIGPKHGFHSIWIDRELSPDYFCMIELPSKREMSREWGKKILCPHEIIYDDMLRCKQLVAMEPFDLVFFTGVLYHNVEQIKMLSVLRNITQPKGMMILQSTIYESNEAVVKLSWKAGQLGGYCFPSRKALLLMLSMTGWHNICIFPDYRPKSNTIIMTCEKGESQPVSYTKMPFGQSSI